MPWQIILFIVAGVALAIPGLITIGAKNPTKKWSWHHTVALICLAVGIGAGVASLRLSESSSAISETKEKHRATINAILIKGGVVGLDDEDLIEIVNFGNKERVGFFGDLEFGSTVGMIEQSLKILSLEGSNITNSALQKLSDFPQLQRLNLGETDVSDDAMSEVSNCTKLEYLNLNGCEKITRTGIEKLVDCANIRELHLSGTDIGNDEIKYVVDNFPSLTDLNVNGVSVDDGAIKHLLVHKKLKRLYGIGVFKERSSDDWKKLVDKISIENLVE